MILGTIAPVGEHVHVRTTDGEMHDGYFNNHLFPFCMFRTTNLEDIYLAVDQITSVIPQKDN